MGDAMKGLADGAGDLGYQETDDRYYHQQARNGRRGATLGRLVPGRLVPVMLASPTSQRISRAMLELSIEQSRINVRRRELELESSADYANAMARPQGAPEVWADIAVLQAELAVEEARLDLRRAQIDLRAHDVEQREQDTAAAAKERAVADQEAAWNTQRTAHVTEGNDQPEGFN